MTELKSGDVFRRRIGGTTEVIVLEQQITSPYMAPYDWHAVRVRAERDLSTHMPTTVVEADLLGDDWQRL